MGLIFESLLLLLRCDYSCRPARIRAFRFMLDVSRADLVAGVAGSGTMGRGIVAGARPMRRAHARVRRPAGRRAQGQGLDRRRPSASSPSSGKPRARRRRRDAAAASRSSSAWRRSRPASSWSRRSSRISAQSASCSRSSRRSSAPTAILASNTSSLSVTAMAAACKRPRARRRLSLLQPGAGDEDRRSGGRRAHRAVGRPTRSPRSRGASATRRCAARTRRASSSTTPAAPTCPRRCASSPRASPTSPPSTASWSTPPASASARSA